MEIEYITFIGTQSGLLTASRANSMLENANEQAAYWINTQENLEIINIASSFGNSAATTTVWYKRIIPTLKPAKDIQKDE